MVGLWLLPLALAAEPEKPIVKSIPVEFTPAVPDAKQAPRFSPKGTQITLKPKAFPGLEGFDHLEGHIKLGPNSKKGEGQPIVLARSEKGKPYDRLFVADGNDEQIAKTKAISTKPNTVRDKLWSNFSATLKVNHPGQTAPEEYLVAFWIVVEKPEEVPTVIRFSRRGFLIGSIKIGEVPHEVLLADSNNDAVYGPGDHWTVRTATPIKPFGIEVSRDIGDFAWSDGKAWMLELKGSSGRVGKLVPHSPGMTAEEDAIRRDRLREDRLAQRAPKPVPFRTDVEAAIKEAQAKKTPYFIKFETDWCGPCKQMQTYVFTAKDVVEAAGGTICLIVDGDKSKDLVEKYQVKGYPTGILFNSDGEEITRYSGYNSVKQVTAFFKKAP